MKIKCPTCRDVRMDFAYQEHYEAYHKLIFKIHEKMEALEAEYIRSAAYAINNGDIRMGMSMVIDELKSLLENEK